MSLEQHIPATDGFELDLQALFGARLKEARRQTDPTQTALAASTGLMRQYVTKFGRPQSVPLWRPWSQSHASKAWQSAACSNYRFHKKIASNQINPLAPPACT